MSARARKRLQKALDRLEGAAERLARPAAAKAPAGYPDRVRAEYRKLRADNARLEHAAETASERVAVVIARLKGALEG